MFVDPEKRNENITEYLLYLWHTEDLIRSCKFDMAAIKKLFDNSYFDSLPAPKREQLITWFEELIDKMKAQGIEKKGHLEESNLLLEELSELHEALLNVFMHGTYMELYKQAQPNINELRKRSKGAVKSDLEACFVGLYGMFLLRLQKKELNKETQNAVRTFGHLLKCLSEQYKKMKNDNLDFPLQMKN